MESRRIKCVFVGDGVVGKTCLLTKKITGNFPTDYVPTVFDNYTTHCEIGGLPYELNLVDTAGQEGYENLRRYIYPGTNVFVLCFAVHRRSSFENIPEKWIPDIRAVCPSTPILLVGCQADVRTNHSLESTTFADGKKLAKSIGAAKYLECSALTNDGVDQVFTQAALVGAGITDVKKCLVM